MGVVVVLSEKSDFCSSEHVLWSSEVFEPTEILGQTTYSFGILLPTQHGLVSLVRVIRKYFACALNFSPIHRALLQPVYIIVAVMRLL